MATSKTVAVELSNVSKSFGKSEVLSRVSFSVEEGEILALLGPSGCGKSTLLKILAGFFEADAGLIRLHGDVINGVPPYKRNLGMVFQDYSLFPHMTIFDNVAFGLTVRKRPNEEIKERVSYALDLVQLPEVSDRFPSQLSGGQQQRVAIARALAVNPSVLLCDEPLSNLDARLRKDIQLELRRIQRETGITMIYVTHDQEEAITLADRIALLNAGEIEQLATSQTVFEHPRTLFAAKFLGYNNFMAGTVLQHESGAAAQIRLTNGNVVRVTPQTGAKLQVNALICIREERIEVFRRGEDAETTVPAADHNAAMVACTIIEIVYTGVDYSIVATDSEGQLWRARVSVQAFHQDTFSVNAPIWMRLPSKEMRILEGAVPK